jgi:hypothetical protein
MTLPKFGAEFSLYKSPEHYRASRVPIGARGVTLSQGNLPLPFGSYLFSCVQCFNQDGQLSCLCPDFFGNYDSAAITISLCGNQDIANCDGALFCGGCPF